MILITGASSGIGEACAEAFAQKGKALFLVARRSERLEALADRLRQRFGVRVETATVDVQETAQIFSLATTHGDLLREVEVLVNNAGLALGLDLFQDAQWSDWDQMIDTNLKGVLAFTKLVLPYFLERNSGQLILMGSVAARWMYPRGHVYSATKAAVHALGESLRLDLLGTRVRVTTLAPGMVETEFSAVRFKGDEHRASAVYERMTPLSAQDVADTVVWVASRPSHVNVQELVLYPVDQASPTHVSRK
ncbi:MAG: NADP-dependent 3-hydroxy acid dehydrogenase YdfG [Pseudomonadota bacterium]|jgi:NADP-dependent 3-hydroxy acid dehydrogenase YdfG